MPSLAVHNVSVQYGAVRAVDGVDLEVHGGRLAGLIGPNGAGKTTFLDACTGFVASTGTVKLDGTRLERRSAYERARAGLVRTFQSLDLFPDQTVLENVAAGLGAGRHTAGLRHLLRPVPTQADPAVHEVLELVGLTDVAPCFPSELSQGQRALVALARALVARPSVLLLDEPAAGLDTGESRRLGESLRAVVEHTGAAVMLVEHDMGLVLGFCDDVHVLDTGRLICSGTPAHVRADAAVLAAYLGTDIPGLDDASDTNAAPGLAGAPMHEEVR